MADYDARERELVKSMEELQGQLQPLELVRCLPIVKTVAPERTNSIAALATLLRLDGFDPIAENAAALYQNPFDRVVTPLSGILDGLTNVTPALDAWREQAATRESAFFGSLKGLGLAEARDEMAALHTTLTQMIGVLERKWATMSEESQRLEKIEQDAAAAMTDIVAKCLSKDTDAWARYGDTTRDVLGYLIKIPDLVNDAVVYLAIEAGVPEAVAKLIPKISLVGKDSFALAKEYGIPAGDFAKAEPWLARDPGMAVSEIIQKGFGPTFEALVAVTNVLYKNVLPLATDEYTTQLSALKSQLPNHGSILVSVSQTRRDVDEFLAKSGLDRLRTVYDRATHALDEWAAGTVNAAQKTDADLFNRNVREAFSKRFEQMTHEFEEFVRANQGRFIGTVDKSTEHDLLWTDIWADRTEGLANLGMYDRLQEWRSGTLEIKSTFATASSQLFEKLRYVAPDLQDKISKKLNDYWDTVRAQVNQGADQTAGAMATAQTRVSTDQIRKDLSRSELVAKLRA